MSTKSDSQVSANVSKPAKLSLRRETVKTLAVRTAIQTGLLIGGCGDSCSIFTNNTHTHCVNGTKA